MSDSPKGCYLATSFGTLSDFFRSWAELQAEIIVLRHQLNLLRGK
jgi:hypothetical protein